MANISIDALAVVSRFVCLEIEVGVADVEVGDALEAGGAVFAVEGWDLGAGCVGSAIDDGVEGSGFCGD